MAQRLNGCPSAHTAGDEPVTYPGPKDGPDSSCEAAVFPRLLGTGTKSLVLRTQFAATLRSAGPGALPPSDFPCLLVGPMGSAPGSTI